MTHHVAESLQTITDAEVKSKVIHIISNVRIYGYYIYELTCSSPKCRRNILLWETCVFSILDENYAVQLLL